MKYKKIEHKFKLENFINTNSEYDLWITSFAIALQDLIKTHKLIFHLSDSKEMPNYTFFLFKISLGFLKESVDLVESSLKSNIAERLVSIKNFKKKYDEFIELITNDPDYKYLKDFINESRNKVFHYNNFQKRNDAKSVKKILNELYVEDFRTEFTLTSDHYLFSDYTFAEDIQLNQLISIIEKQEKTKALGDRLHNLLIIMAKIMTLLQDVIFDFIIDQQSNPKILRIKFK
ncbi:hypothetical protein SAMN05720606_109202 [Paenibacillus polysaccharolyticus]|uniref:Uncharacterized protein n=1 Tax=Paenibacillus polysaccharolyticus TaxID=582692 RepID=A0A1G5IV94_9BACL|nr:hypothetical protein [Paenibacillus polysaccharolyticus]SCY80002.1 hypothetical protein SAMN05720606_109202 [Paenibacillus polysaccharolyticus]